MKNFTFSLKALIAGVLMTGAVTAQTTIIEMDGASNEFEPNDWLITNDMGFSSSSSIVIEDGESGTLSLSNTSYYSDIQVEIHFSQGGAVPITFESMISDGNSNINAPNTITTDANTPKVGTYGFSNATGFAISTFTISNLSMNGTIVYLKISGVLESGSSELDEYIKNNVHIYAYQNNLQIESNVVGIAELYTLDGRRAASFEVVNGTNLFSDLENNIYLVAVRDEKGNIIKKSKIAIR